MTHFFKETKDFLRYRGGPGQWSYLFHRVTGLGVLLFLCIHIVDTALVLGGPALFNRVMALYRHPLFRLSEIFLFASVLFHALNGVRLIVVDFWPGATRRHRGLAYATWGAFFVLLVPVTVIMLMHWARAS